jgi:hypothetical protein
MERPFRYIRQDFFLGRTFRNLDDLNAQLADWLATVANVRVHATTRRVVAEAWRSPKLQDLPTLPFGSVLELERRVSHEGMVSVGGSLHSVPDAADLVGQRVHLDDPLPGGPSAARRLRGRRPPARRSGRAAVTAAPEIAPAILDRIRQTPIGLRMPRAMAVLDQTIRQLECGQVSALEAIHSLLAEELTVRENRRIKTALARLTAVKTLAGFDFSFQPSLDRNRILTSPSSSSSAAMRWSTFSARPAPSRTWRWRSASRR